MNRNEKEAVVAQLTEDLGQSQAVFLTDFQGLKVDQLSDLRRKIREAGGRYQVAKNTLIKRAIKDTPLEPLTDMLTGNNALSMTDGDAAALAKSLVEYAKGQDKLVIKGGILSGKTVSYEQVKAIADLPSWEVLLAMTLGTMNAVPSGFVRVLAAVPQKLVYALAAISDQKKEAA